MKVSDRLDKLLTESANTAREIYERSIGIEDMRRREHEAMTRIIEAADELCRMVDLDETEPDRAGRIKRARDTYVALQVIHA